MTGAEELREQYGWEEHPSYPKSDWRADVEAESTLDGYWQWVYDQVKWTLPADDDERGA